MTAITDKLKRTRLWKPTPRDQAIYHAVAVEGRTQKEAGAEFGRSQPAVSRLLKRFERWRGGANPEDSGDLDGVRQAHLDRWLARQRHDEIYTRAMRLAQRMEEQPAAIRRKRTDAEGAIVWNEETQRDQLAAAGQMLKTALRASESLTELADKTPVAGASAEVDREGLLGTLKKLRHQAEEAGRVPKSGTSSTAEIWLRALLGEEHGWQRWHEDSDHAALLKLIDSVLESRCGLGEALRVAKGSGVGVQESHQPDAQARDIGSQPGGAPSTEYPVLSTAETPALVPSLGASSESDASAPAANPQSEIPNPQSPPPPTHQTHRRIFVGGHPPTDTSRVSLDPSPPPAMRCDPYRGGGQVVMIDPGTGKKYGEPADDYADDPLGKLYRRIEERQKREREARARAGS